MIEYHGVSICEIKQIEKYTEWLEKVVHSEGYTLGNLNYVFMEDEELLAVNKKYLNHNYYTDIITFDYTEDKEVSGDIMISCQRVKENAITFQVKEEEELKRVMVHGILHLMGYKDDTKKEKELMRSVENTKIKMFHVEQ